MFEDEDEHGGESAIDQQDRMDYLDSIGYDDGDDDVDSYDADEHYGFQPWGGDLPN
jgi:hypothetical protein